jgi:uncharacterized protein
MTPHDIIRTLHLKPHPEGGYYSETHRIGASDGKRSPGTAIYYLLERGDRSHWHRVDATEIWHFYSGAPLELSVSPGKGIEVRVLGPDLAANERPQVVVPPGRWQSARSLGDWTLVGCTVSPGFEFSGFEMAPPDWEPAR